MVLDGELTLVWFCRHMATSEECAFFYHRVQVHIPQAVELVMLVPKQGHKKSHTPLVSLSQVYKVLVDGTCSYQHFHAKVKNKLEHRHSSKMLKGEDMQVMIRLEATPPSTPSLLVGSSTAVLLAMVECKCPPPNIQAMEAIKLRSIKLEFLPIPPHIMNPCLGTLPQPLELKVVGPFPKTLPAYELSHNVMRSYGLMATKPNLALTHPLHRQLSQLQSWCTTPIQLDRHGPPLATSTFQHHTTNISLFLGHCHWFQGVEQPNLREYLHSKCVITSA